MRVRRDSPIVFARACQGLQTILTKQRENFRKAPNHGSPVSIPACASTGGSEAHELDMLILLSHTRRILISAGETPEIRDACPTVAGRIVMNFCRASARKLGTVA